MSDEIIPTSPNSRKLAESIDPLVFTNLELFIETLILFFLAYVRISNNGPHDN